MDPLFDTDAKLRGLLDSNQFAREGLCQAILSIDGRFSGVKSLHPRGGPDGGRDIEATYKNTLLARAGVGFVNNANDSAPHKTKAKNKFKADALAALRAKPKPDVFAFLTNVTLTMGEKKVLSEHAISLGYVECDVYDRQRIVSMLNNTDGFAARYQYLRIPMSESEQAAFFAKWGDDIQAVVGTGFGRVEQMLRRIQFLHEYDSSIRRLSAALHLDRTYSGEEIGHFRAFVTVSLKEVKHGIFMLHFGQCDRSRRLDAESKLALELEPSGAQHGAAGAQWEHRIPQADEMGQSLDRRHSPAEIPDIPDSSIDEEGESKPRRTWSGIRTSDIGGVQLVYDQDDFIRLEPCLNVKDIDDSMFIFVVSEQLAEKVDRIEIYANEYLLYSIQRDDFKIDRSKHNPSYPILFTEEELSERWVRLRPSSFSSSFHLRFSEHTPHRFYDPKPLEAPLVAKRADDG